MTDRWMLNRAGIVNVYQYGQETLHFGGGRLLLRGVNGSGKSTAMNMLLPFLLDGDTRRIDAAGEQAGVLKAWMLSGRSDAQPIGYLWLELARGEESLTFGCGIKANRAADSVTTWWWITSRRPDIDLFLVEDKHPLSLEALRATLEPDPVFRQEQRNLYRHEVRSRLFGGADIDQHIRLLHIVRNPRVGDRIDVELPGHLYDALPQLSEAALLDAAQPLDDLEEHRRNVEELTHTAQTLDALGTVYAAYARAEVRRRAAEAREVVAQAEGTRRAAAEARRRAAEAAEALGEVTQRVERLTNEERRLNIELDSLKDSPAYAEGRQLEELRQLVRTTAQKVELCARLADERTTALGEARSTLEGAAQSAQDDRRMVEERLRDLAGLVILAGLPLSAPDVPTLSTTVIDADALLTAPALALSDAGTRKRLEELRAAGIHRRSDLDEVRQELDAVDAAERRLVHCTETLEAATAEAERKRTVLTGLRQALDEALTAWRAALLAWVERLDGHRTASGLSKVATPDLGADLVGRRDTVAEALRQGAEESLSYHLEVVAALEAVRRAEQDTVDEREEALAALNAIVVPAPPSLRWQRADRGVVLAELVDFKEELDPADRVGIEAAMEAAGLLGAEVTAAGSLQLAEGGLVVRAGPAAEQPLSQLLVAAGAPGTDVDPGAVTRLLDTISIAPDQLDAAGMPTVVTVDGEFRIGVLRGRHQKNEAEHIGLTARRAALERQRGEARERFEQARVRLAATEAALVAGRERVAEARAIRAALPSSRALGQALLAADSAEQELAAARQVATERQRDRDLADEAHAEAVDKSRRIAANLGLPTDPTGLSQIERAVNDVSAMTHGVGDALTAWGREVAHWMEAAQRWRESDAQRNRAVHDLAAARGEYEPLASRLATIEDSIGVAYAEIVRNVEFCERELGRIQSELRQARANQLTSNTDHVNALAGADELGRATEGAARRCVDLLAQLRRAFAVPGLLAAATDASAAIRLPVEESPAGLRALAAAVEAHVAAPPRSELTADSVRQSLRQRRDALGAGWDAEDRQADETLPLAIEINGPQGRFPLAEAIEVVGTRLKELTSLLSSEQDSALRNLLQGLVAREVAEKLHAASDLIARMNRRLDSITTAHGIGVILRWRRRDGLDPELATMVELLARPPDLRTTEQDGALRDALSSRLDQARRDEPDAPFRELIAQVLDYRSWHEITVLLRRPGRADERLTRRTALSEGEKKIVSYLPLFAAVAASCDSLAETAPGIPRFLLLDDAFAKVSEDNHPKLFGLLVELDLDFIATSERLWGTHRTVPELAITEVIRDAALGVIVLEHSRWDGTTRSPSV